MQANEPVLRLSHQKRRTVAIFAVIWDIPEDILLISVMLAYVVYM